MSRVRCQIAALGFALILAGCGLQETKDSSEKTEETQSLEQLENSETETESVTETETEEVVEPEIKELTITATGDCTLGAVHTHSYKGSFHDYYDQYGPDYFFQNFQEIFEKDDMTLINLECVLTESTNRVEKKFNLKGKPEYTNVITSGDIEACSLGNNHASDYGSESHEDTKKFLEEAGIVYAYNDIVSYYTTEDDIVVGIVSTSVLSGRKTNRDYLLNGVETARTQGADIVIACCHWGIEREYYPNEYQRQLGHDLIDAGADLVVGNHPHVLQGMEYYNGKIICYSLGNFCFGGNKNPGEKNTAVFQQTFTFVDGVLQDEIHAKMIPSRVSGHNNYNDFQPMIANEEQWKKIVEQMNTYSKPYSSLSFAEDGTILIQE